MLDNESTNDNVTGEPQQAAAPTRRRRAASRPAGAPAAAPPAPPADSGTVTATPSVDTPVAEKSAVEKPAVEKPAVEKPADETSASATAEITPRRRRAATKPAGEPTRRRRVAVKGEEPAQESLGVEAPEPAPAGDTPADTREPVAEKKPARRRSTRAAAAPVAAEPTTPPVAEDADTAAPAAAVEESAAGELPAVAAEAPRATRRRRATRPTAAAAGVEEASEAAAGAPAADEEPAAPTGEIPVAEEPAAAPRATATRRRRASRPAAAAESTPAADDDPIAQALRAAEDLAEARKAVLTDPFMTAEARDAQLAALAGAIAGDATAEDEDEDSDETVEVESDETDADETDDDGDTDESESDDDSESESDDDSDDESTDDDSDEDRPVRRRRRRGGRRRRRSGRDDDASESGDADSDDDSDNGDDAASDDESGDDAADSNGTDDSSSEGDGVSRRRRRRRRRSEGSGDSNGEDEVTGIEGSTRMEAKRQRRKESRAAGRRRAPILSEAEFLARREAVDRKLIIRQSDDYTQLAVIEDDILVEHYVDKASATSLIGNIYVGKVQNVLPSMEAAFIDIGRGRNAVLYAGEVDWAAFGVTGEQRKVENVLKSGQSVLVQVTKDPVGAKGARLTSHISLPGRYVVYSPGGHLSGISRKLPDVERNRLRSVLGHLISEDESVIVRTAAEGASEEELVRDVNRLKAQWEVIEKKSKTGGSPQALYAEPDLTLRIVRDLFTEDFGALVIQGNGGSDDAFDAISAYVGHVAPQLADRLQRYEVAEDGKDVFARYRIDEQIAKALDRKVYLPSGGSLVIDRTEAMTVIDVNTGRFTGSGGNLEATVTSNNLEAAEEIVRQLRLRDLGGIIVIDFIDMVLPSNRELLLRRLVECLGRDRTRHQVAEVTSLGLVQLTRKRIGTGLAEAFTEPCDHCHGAGYLRFDEPVDSQAPADGGERRGTRRRRK